MCTNSRTIRGTLFFTCLFMYGVNPYPALAKEDSQAKERALIEVLRSRPAAEKAIACKELAIYGGKQAVPDLAALLSDEQLASWSRIALEAIPDPEAGAALLKATDSLNGRLLVGAVNSIGVRRDAAAVERLVALVQSDDGEVASAAAVALGRIGNDPATAALRQSLATTSDNVRSAVAEGCILCAERLTAAGKSADAAVIYDEVREADVPKPRVLEATLGAILARGTDGASLLIKQLQSTDKERFQIGLAAGRRLPGQTVADALGQEIVRATPERAALLLSVLVDRADAAMPQAVLAAAKAGDKRVRIAAIDVIARRGDDGSVPALMEISGEDDAELAEAAIVALAALPSDRVDAIIVERLATADGQPLAALIDVVGRRRIHAFDALVKAVDHADPAVRSAVLTAMGETISPDELPVLIARVVGADSSEDAPIALRALLTASVRMPDRDACAAQVASALPRASAATKAKLLEVLGAIGGKKALEAIATTLDESGDDQLQDAGTRVLGQWMNTDAAPVLLKLASSPTTGKYQVRALRGYIRLARQFPMPDDQRAAMCRSALQASQRPDEQKLVLEVLERYPSIEALKVAAEARQVASLDADAVQVMLLTAQKLRQGGVDAQEMMAIAGLAPMKIEIVKAEYGAGATHKDVTRAVLDKVSDLPLILLPSPSYNESFGGDPAPGTAKQLKVSYRINGKPGQASFAENATIILPIPK